MNIIYLVSRRHSVISARLSSVAVALDLSGTRRVVSRDAEKSAYASKSARASPLEGFPLWRVELVVLVELLAVDDDAMERGGAERGWRGEKNVEKSGSSPRASDGSTVRYTGGDEEVLVRGDVELALDESELHTKRKGTKS